MAMAPLAEPDTAWIVGTCQNKDDDNNGDAER
jgi:hypothetical protein